AGMPVPEAKVAGALGSVEWPARFQLFEDGRLVLDGAHNPGAAVRLVNTWRQRFGDEKATIVMAMMRDKDAPSFARALAPVASRIFTVAARNPRSHSAESLRALVSEVAPTEAFGGLREALDRARGFSEPILICGSLFLAGEAL